MNPPNIANAPCARLMNRISPSVTDIPTLMTNSRPPYATPSNSTVMNAAMVSAGQA